MKYKYKIKQQVWFRRGRNGYRGHIINRYKKDGLNWYVMRSNIYSHITAEMPETDVYAY